MKKRCNSEIGGPKLQKSRSTIGTNYGVVTRTMSVSYAVGHERASIPLL